MNFTVLLGSSCQVVLLTEIQNSLYVIALCFNISLNVKELKTSLINSLIGTLIDKTSKN